MRSKWVMIGAALLAGTIAFRPVVSAPVNGDFVLPGATSIVPTPTYDVRPNPLFPNPNNWYMAWGSGRGYGVGDLDADGLPDIVVAPSFFRYHPKPRNGEDADGAVLRNWQIRIIVQRMLRTITVKLQDRVLADIEAEARSRRVSRSEVLRERLELSEASKASVWEKMQDLVVRDDRAPADLASNKARLRGYGRSGTG